MILRAVVVAVLGLLVATEAAANCLMYAKEVSLVGKVQPTLVYGPPNFGEDPSHDEKDTAAFLKLAHPIIVCGGQDDAFGPPEAQTVSEMQMIFHEPPYGKQWNGKRVVVLGKLFPAETAWHHTPVMLDVMQVQKKK